MKAESSAIIGIIVCYNFAVYQVCLMAADTRLRDIIVSSNPPNGQVIGLFLPSMKPCYCIVRAQDNTHPVLIFKQQFFKAEKSGGGENGGDGIACRAFRKKYRLIRASSSSWSNGAVQIDTGGVISYVTHRTSPSDRLHTCPKQALSTSMCNE